MQQSGLQKERPKQTHVCDTRRTEAEIKVQERLENSFIRLLKCPIHRNVRVSRDTINSCASCKYWAKVIPIGYDGQDRQDGHDADD